MVRGQMVSPEHGSTYVFAPFACRFSNGIWKKEKFQEHAI